MWYRASSKVEAPAAPSYMTYLASKSVIEYFSIGKRRELVKKIPSLRRVNARIPFHFDKVSLYYDNFSYRMKLDDVEWILKSEQTRLFGTVETVVNGTTTVKDFRLLFSYVDQLMKAYLNGNGRIRELSIVRFPHLPKHKVIGRLEMQFWQNTPLVDELANVQCNHAVLKSLEPTPDDFYEELKVRNLEISEPRTTFEKFRRMCRQLKEGNRHELGSFYQSEYEGFVGFVNEFWEELKGELHGEMWYNDSFTSKMANEKYKLLVTRKTDYNGRQDNFLFRVEIAELRIEDHLTANLRIFCNLEEHYIGKTIWILIVYPFIIWNINPIIAFVYHLISTISLSSTVSNIPGIVFVSKVVYNYVRYFHQEWTIRPRRTWMQLTIITVYTAAFMIADMCLFLKIFQCGHFFSICFIICATGFFPELLSF